MNLRFIFAAIVLLLGLGVLAFRQREAAAALHREIAIQQQDLRQLDRLRRERQHAEQLAADEINRLRRDHAEMLQLRTELDALVKTGKPAEPPATRPVPKGAVPLSALRTVGRGSPSAAFQTAIWAVMNGRDEELSSVTMSFADREMGQRMIASLPEKERARYSSPEKLWALFITPEIAKWDQIVVVNETVDSPGHATLTVASSGPEAELKLQAELSDQGWQLVIPEPHMRAIQQQFRKLTAPKIVQKLLP